MNDTGTGANFFQQLSPEAQAEWCNDSRRWAEEDFVERCARELDSGLLDRATDNGH